MEKKYHILLTNDDGIQSPGLWAAAEALSELGYVHVVAPREQYSGAGRSMPVSSDGRIQPKQMEVHGRVWTVYAVGGSPAQAVEHGVLEIVPRKPDLVVSGINFGENVGIGITASGTVGAAIEGAVFGIPSIAASLETSPEYYYSHSMDIDFSTAGYFTAFFARRMLEKKMPEDVDILKVDIPSAATRATPWKVTGLSRLPYYELTVPERNSWDESVKIGYHPLPEAPHPPGSDCYALRVEKIISVTPLSIDMTSRVDFDALTKILK
jgi:5'-nucleotidase